MKFKTKSAKSVILVMILFVGTVVNAQSAIVDLSLRPAGAFKAKTDELTGSVTQKGNSFDAENIVVKLGNLKTGIELRDSHTKKHLEVEKFPEAILISAHGENGKGEGTIKIRGIEKKIFGSYKVEGSILIAEFPVKLSDFGISGIKYMGVGVDDEAKVTVEVPVKK